ncbi:hypothetical protein [Hymenobacter elongatus]|uniref:Quinol oxidase subunit 4 n=1 Tax=Hymenobacter elongatus TaxID=877208 RepID=A0A4Z0PMD0_9BACT|nr:hypothetical protein [Hymenobacter elongatus]TGE15948.1 hypothetical protein E5J99_10975 [Hymenobacter elongatus]
MTFFLFRGLRRLLALGLLSCLLSVTCHPYRIPNPTGPPRPKVTKAKKVDNEAADGRSLDVATEAKPIKNRYDKHDMLKKPKYKSRRLKKKVGQRTIFGFPLPF